jgi:hypothetical protein
MALKLHLTVKSIGRGTSEAVLTAEASETVIPQGNLPHVDADAISSTTEGKVNSAELRLSFDEHSCPLQVGQVVTLTGDFAALEVDEDEPTALAESTPQPEPPSKKATVEPAKKATPAKKAAPRKAPAKKAAAKKAAAK